MRELHASMISSVDGFYEGPSGDFRWADKFEEEEFKQYSSEMLLGYDTLLFGRKTYELGTAYWKSELASNANESPDVIEKMNKFRKVVFSTTLTDPQWGETTIYNGDLVDRVTELKNEPGNPILLIGSTSMRSPLLDAGLIDRLKVWYFPLALGEGSSLFKGISQRLRLETRRVTTFHNGNIRVEYNVLGPQA